jgi:uncharacterized repeat protein (TIGR02543 family)
MKKIASFILIATLLLSVLLVSCDSMGGSTDGLETSDSAKQESPIEGCTGVEFALSEDGTCYFLRRVSKCTKPAIVVPSTYNDLPVVSISNYAFRSCLSLKTIVIPASVEYIGKHAFYGMNNSTIYCEAEKKPDEWHSRFNTSYRPVFYGCEISEDGYVTSIIIKENNPANPNAKNGILSPERAGYDFIGWASAPDATTAEYTCDNVTSAPQNTKLYPIWMKTN